MFVNFYLLSTSLFNDNIFYSEINKSEREQREIKKEIKPTPYPNISRNIVILLNRNGDKNWFQIIKKSQMCWFEQWVHNHKTTTKNVCLFENEFQGKLNLFGTRKTNFADGFLYFQCRIWIFCMNIAHWCILLSIIINKAEPYSTNRLVNWFFRCHFTFFTCKFFFYFYR